MLHAPQTGQSDLRSRTVWHESRLFFIELPAPCGYLLVVIDWSSCSDVESVPGKLGGAWVFKHTRLPVSALFENLAAGATVHQLVEWFPGVEKRQVLAVLKFAAEHSRYPEELPALPAAV